MVQEIYQKIYIILAAPATGVSEWFVKALWRLETCVSDSINVSGKLVSLVPILFDESVRFTPVSFFVADLVY